MFCPRKQAKRLEVVEASFEKRASKIPTPFQFVAAFFFLRPKVQSLKSIEWGEVLATATSTRITLFSGILDQHKLLLLLD